MLRIEDPSKTWMLGDFPIYNFQEDGNLGRRRHMGEHRSNLCFVNGHVGSGISISKGIVNTTKYYSFLPTPTWLDPADTARNCNCQ